MSSQKNLMCLGLRKAGRNTPLSCSKNRAASLGSEKGLNTELSLGRIEGKVTGSFFFCGKPPVFLSEVLYMHQYAVDG